MGRFERQAVGKSFRKAHAENAGQRKTKKITSKNMCSRLNLKIGFLLLILIWSCNSSRTDYLKGRWTLISLSGVEEKNINDGNYFRTGFRVTFYSDKNRLKVKMNTEDYAHADFSIDWKDSLFRIMNSEETWLNGNYSFDLHTTEMAQGIIEDRMELYENKKEMTLVRVTNRRW